MEDWAIYQDGYECNQCKYEFWSPGDTNDNVEEIIGDGKDCCPLCGSTDISERWLTDDDD